jgi:cell shape-determining protein MreC
MRKIIFMILAGFALAACLFSSCRGQVTIKSDQGMDTIVFDTDSMQSININMNAKVRVTTQSDSLLEDSLH